MLLALFVSIIILLWLVDFWLMFRIDRRLSEHHPEARAEISRKYVYPPFGVFWNRDDRRLGDPELTRLVNHQYWTRGAYLIAFIAAALTAFSTTL